MADELERPDWMLAWQDYPHSVLSVKQARELNKYCVQLEDTVRDRERQRDSETARADGWRNSYAEITAERDELQRLMADAETERDMQTEYAKELQRQLDEARKALGDARVHLMCERLPGAHRTDMPLSVIDKALGNDAARKAE